MNKETILQNEIRLGCADIAVLYRINVGLFKTIDGRRVSTGVMPGFSDLFGYRRLDGKAVFLEVKTAQGKETAQQSTFLAANRRAGAVTGVVRSVMEAREVILGDGIL